LARHLTKEDIEIIIDMLDGWQGKLTWNGVCEAYKQRTGHVTTRQTLCSHEQISTAYTVRKKGVGKPTKRVPNSLTVAAQRIERLEAGNDRMREQIKQYEARFLRWIYNAQKKGVTINDLNQQLPEIERGSSVK